MQEASSEAFTEQGEDLQINLSQLKRDMTMQIALPSLWIPVVCSGEGTTKPQIKTTKTRALGHHLMYFVWKRGDKGVH